MLDKSDEIYFRFIREALERYTFSEKDLSQHPDYYISDVELKQIIIELKTKHNL
jgi:hypothetical protein